MQLDEALSRAEASDAEASEATARAATAEEELLTARDELAEARRETEQTGDAVADLNERIVELDGEFAAQGERVVELEGELKNTVALLTQERDRADAAESEAQRLQALYDPEIRAAAQASWDTELAEACAEAGDGTSTIARYVDFTAELETIGTEAELIDLVTQCAAPLRERSAEERLEAECSPGSVDQIIKAPDELAGNCYVVFVIPWQWDSRTGECNFLGAWDGSDLGTRRFNYDGDGVFRAPPEVCETDLGDADQDDLLKVWVELSGSFRYDTAAGGSNEIPDFLIRRASLITKA